jgi:hypothetical protein
MTEHKEDAADKIASEVRKNWLVQVRWIAVGIALAWVLSLFFPPWITVGDRANSLGAPFFWHGLTGVGCSDQASNG